MTRIASLLQLLLFALLILSSNIQSPPATSVAAAATTAHTQLCVTDFGAKGDGVNYDTIAIQSAINTCPSSTSIQCHVTFPPGKYLTATVHLNRSNTFLDIRRGATLLGGTNWHDYPTDSARWYVVLAENVTDVGITGGGVIDGQGLEFVERFSEVKNVMISWNQTGSCLGDECRPRLVGFVGCRNVRIWNVTLNQPAYWCLHLVCCNNTTIHDVSIYGDFNTPNNDGIDIEDSNNTFITRCHIDTGDDAICPKTHTGPLYNLTATNCWIRSKSSAIKLGSASSFGFKGLVFANITIFESHRGLAFQIRDGGNVSDVTFSNINITTRYYHPSWWGRAEPIYVTTCPRSPNSSEGSISNINFFNITSKSENGVFLSGSKGGVLSNIRFINVNLTYARWTNFVGGLVDYRPGCQGIVSHQAAGIIMENIRGVEVDNVIMGWFDDNNQGGEWDNPLDFRPSTVDNVSFINFHSAMYKQSMRIGRHTTPPNQ